MIGTQPLCMECHFGQKLIIIFMTNDQDIFTSSQDFHDKWWRSSWWMAKVFIMTDLDFHDEQSKFSSWQVKIYIMTGPDFHHERSRIAYRFGYNPKVQGEHLTVQLLWGATWLLVTCVSLIYIVDEFLFLLLVKLNKMRWLNESKVLSFCSLC